MSAVLTPATVAQQNTVVPAGGNASYTLPNFLCLHQSATNAVASQAVALSGTAPFVYATESEIN